MVNELESPLAQTVGPMPGIATKVAGKKYALEPNKMGMQSLVLSFKDARECTMRVTMRDQILAFPVGLDGDFRIVDTGIPMGNNSEPSWEIARNFVESKRPSELIDYATAIPFAIGLLEAALAIEDNSIGI